MMWRLQYLIPFYGQIIYCVPILFIHSSVDEYVHREHFLALTNNATMNIPV